MEQTQKQPEKKNEERIVRIMSKDVEGGMTLYAGLTKIKGISWALSNALCKLLNLDKKRKIGSLTKDEIEKITQFLKTSQFPKHILNRKSDFKTGEDKHLTGTDLELQTEFDVKRLKKIKSYRGYRHMLGLPARGQRTRGNFRPHKMKGVGIKKKKKITQ
ncbi:MAG: 30S ribosomal protein S13 [Nanoarchaeota archaeon]|nr:30S ribosomal protein S13 [Nanoarchaeota archaeon]